MKQLILLIFCTITLGAFAQSNDSQLALKYFQDKEFEKAASLYQKLYKKKGKKTYFNYYLKSLIGLKDFKTAEKVVKAQIKKNRNDFSYSIEYGALLKLQGKTEKANKQFQEVIDALSANHAQILNTANFFSSKNEYDYAMKAYQKGIALLGDPNLFRFDKARLYSMQRDYNGMIGEYLELLKSNQRYYSVVQNNLRYYLSYDIDETMSKLLKKKLLSYARDNPDQTSYTELLIWLYLEEKKFAPAFIQVRALDMRMHSSGQFLNEFAKVAMNNGAYKQAVKAYNTIISFGEKAKPEFMKGAQAGILEARYKELTAADSIPTDAFKALETNMKTRIRENGLENYYPLIERLAETQAFYLNMPDSGIVTLEHFLAKQRKNSAYKPNAELLLGDIYLASDNPWDAILTYARVEKANKHNEIGHEAKFRKTKVAYYTGDFQWAKSQLDILKASTTKLISNDAFAMSMIIDDNFDGDSISEALQQFARAQMAILQKNKQLAITTFDSVFANNPQEIIAEYALFEKAKTQEDVGKLNQAAQTYTQLIEKYPFSIWMDDAIFNLAKLKQVHLNAPKQAQELYKKLLLEHKGSVLVPEARKAFRKLRGDDIMQEKSDL